MPAHWPKRTPPTDTNQYGLAAIPSSQGSAVDSRRCGSRPRAGRRRFNFVPPFHHRGLRCLGMPTAGRLHPELGFMEASPSAQKPFDQRCPCLSAFIHLRDVPGRICTWFASLGNRTLAARLSKQRERPNKTTHTLHAGHQSRRQEQGIKPGLCCTPELRIHLGTQLAPPRPAVDPLGKSPEATQYGDK